MARLARFSLGVVVFSSAALLSFGSFFGCSGGGADGELPCAGGCPRQSLETREVETILSRAEAYARAYGVSATFALTDRVGNVLAVYQMSGANPQTLIDGQLGAEGGLEGALVPSTLAAISKAGTGAYLSSQGNAFSSRTASQIIQEHFDPGDSKAPGGPLFGVQFSQLMCSDLTVADASALGGVSRGAKLAGSIGPRPLPLGLSADPAGLPLYKQGDLVGGLGVELDGRYSLDRNVRDVDPLPLEELIALGASLDYAAPAEIRAERIFPAGRSLRYLDAKEADLPEISPQAFDSSRLLTVPLYFNGQIRPGSTFGEASSGFLSSSLVSVPTQVLLDEQGQPRFPTRSGAPLAGQELKAQEVQALLESAILTANRSRAAIRQPLDDSARVSVFVVDTQGFPIGFVRSDDAPVFGADVALQKARTALLFSLPDGARLIRASLRSSSVSAFRDYPQLMQDFFSGQAGIGTHAYSARAVGNLARPFYPDGIEGNSNGPLSLAFPPASPSWSPFNTGLQSDLSLRGILAPLGAFGPLSTLPSSCVSPGLGEQARNGLQIFAGAVPLYRAQTLVGAIGVSGDGIDQDDLLAFFSASRKGLDYASHFEIGDPQLGFNAPKQLRSDRIVRGDSRLRYVNCPEAPFIGSNEQNVCDAL